MTLRGFWLGSSGMNNPTSVIFFFVVVVAQGRICCISVFQGKKNENIVHFCFQELGNKQLCLKLYLPFKLFPLSFLKKNK